MIGVMGLSSTCVIASAALLGLLVGDPAPARTSDEGGTPVTFPVEPELFIDEFVAAEGITFNAEGDLFIAANRAVWKASPDGAVEKITDLYTNLGMAGIGERDVLVADFGPTNVFRDGPNSDGIVWRVTPEGDKRAVVTGIADPNAILVRDDGSLLISDDGTDKIYLAEPDGAVSVWTRAIPYPNGMALSPDGTVLYVAQIFRRLSVPHTIFDDRVWALPLAAGRPAGPPRLAVETGGSGLDGLAMDEHGRVYIADNQVGKLWRFDPRTDELVLVAAGMPNIASLVFGEGDFDREAIYATCTFRGGGKIWKVPVGARGAPLVRRVGR